MSSKTALIVAGVVVVLIIVIIAFSGFFGGSSDNNGGTSGGTAATAGLNLPPDPSSFPTSTTIGIGTAKGIVTVNNFYTAPVTYDEGTLTFKQAADYSFTYNTADSSFWIVITGGDANAEDKVAEADFMATLGITQADACKLNATWGVAYSLDSSLAGKNYPLSTCSGSYEQ